MTSRSYFGMMNSTLGSVVPLAMFYSLVGNQFPFSASYFFSLADQRGIYTGNSSEIKEAFQNRNKDIKEATPFQIQNFYSASSLHRASKNIGI